MSDGGFFSSFFEHLHSSAGGIGDAQGRGISG